MPGSLYKCIYPYVQRVRQKNVAHRIPARKTAPNNDVQRSLVSC